MDKTTFSERLAEERKRRGFTQKQLAEALGISDRTYSKWETGENEMDVSTLCRLAEFYGESPAVFFRTGGPGSTAVRAELAALPPKEAAERWFQIHTEAMLGMGDALNGWFRSDPPQAVYGQPLPGLEPPPFPTALGGMPDTREVLASFDCPDLMGLVAAGRDANLSLLMLPHREQYAWIEGEAEQLEALFRALSLPGAMGCLRFLLSQSGGIYFSVPYLAEKAGVSPEEAEAFLRAAAEQHFCRRENIRRNGREEPLYCPLFSSELVGILTLAHLQSAKAGRYGHMGGVGGRLPEKGEKP